MPDYGSHTGTPAHETTYQFVPPLSDDELDALGRDANWDSRYGERAIKELREHRDEGVNHHAVPGLCLTCIATESELVVLRETVRQDAADAATVVALYAERDMLRESVVAQDASIVERDIAIIELREQISALKRKRIYSDPIAAQLETLRQMMQRTLVDGNPRAVAETLIDRLYAYTIGLEEQNAKLVAQIHGIADTYRTCGMSRETADAILVTAMANDWPDATQDAGASVKGEQE